MKIEIHLFASFRIGRFKQQQRDYENGTTLREVIVDIGIDMGIKNNSEIGMLLVNGRHSRLDQALKDGDRISIFPLVGGG